MLKDKLNNFKKTPAATAMHTALILGSFVHLFCMVNVIHNYDDIGVQPRGVGTTITSGRWFLQTLYELEKYTTWSYNIPLINGLGLIVTVALAAAILVCVLKIKSKWAARIIGAAFISFPSITAIFFFKYTAPHYGLAILMSISAVWITDRRRYGFLPGSILLAFVLGIYQAYFPVSAALYLIVLIKKALEQNTHFVDILKRGFLYLVTMAVGMITYFIVLKVFLKLYDLKLDAYQNIDKMGSISLSELPHLILSAVTDFIMMPINNYCQLASHILLRLSYIGIGLISCGLIIYLIIKNKKKLPEIVLLVILCALLPIATNLIVIMDAEWVYTLMVLPFVFLMLIPIALCELAEEKKADFSLITLVRKITVGVVALMVFLNSYIANINYVSLYYTNRQVENTVVFIMSQAFQQPEYTNNKKWALLGEVDGNTFSQPVWGEHSSLYGGNADAIKLINSYSFLSWFHLYTGQNMLSASTEEIDQLQQMQEVQDMPTWPNNGSVQVIDEYVIVKFS